MPVLSIDYRLAPEHKHPAPIEDALDALRWLSKNGPAGPRKARKIFIAGDSSGGGLALSVLLAAQRGVSATDIGTGWSPVQVDGGVLICPLTDLSYDFTRSSPAADGKVNSYVTRLWDCTSRTGDPVYRETLGYEADRESRTTWIRNYTGEDADLQDEFYSPHYADSFAGLPPCLVLGADEDLTVDDAVDFAAKASADGVETDLIVWPGMWHDWLMYCEGRDKFSRAPGEDGFTGTFGEFKEGVVCCALIGSYLKTLAARESEFPGGFRE
jgi:acetyl esterase